MTQGFVQVAPDSTGKALGNEVYTVPVGTVLTDGSGNQTVTSSPLYFFREHIVNADPTDPAGVAKVAQRAFPTDYGLVARLPAGQPDLQTMIDILQDMDTVLNRMVGQGFMGSAGGPEAMYAAREGVHGPGAQGAVLPVAADRFGRLITAPMAGRNLTDANSVTITTTTETVIQAADQQNFNELIALIITNTSATAVRVDIRDQLSTDTTPPSTLGVMPFYVPAGDMRGISFNVPNYQSNLNKPWTATCSTGVTDIRIWAYFAQTPRPFS